MPEAKVAFIGGSGLYDMTGLAAAEEIEVQTPFGDPSDVIITGILGETRIAFIPRHGRGHRLSPTEIPVRANIYALKSLGVERIVSISAVGSLREGIRPLDLMIPDQLIDRTKSCISTFFAEGIVAHISFAEPFCPVLSDVVAQAAKPQGVTAHSGGALVVIEGPQFSTKPESEIYRSWGASIIGMTTLPEAKLAREAEICYSTLAMVTDYDVWHDTEEKVSVELVVGNLRENVAVSQEIIKEVVPRIPTTRDCACATALENAIITSPDLIPDSARARVSLIVDKYLKIPKEVR